MPSSKESKNSQPLGHWLSPDQAGDLPDLPPAKPAAPEMPGLFKEPLVWFRFVVGNAERLPRPLRWLLYAAALAALPVYLGLAPRLADELLREKLENATIRLGWRNPLVWSGNIVEGAYDTDAPFQTARWGAPESAVKPNPDGDRWFALAKGDRFFYTLKSPVHGLYDFTARIHMYVANPQGSLTWYMRANRDRDTYYEFRLRSARTKEDNAILDGFAVEGESRVPLHVNDRLVELPPLAPGKSVAIRIRATGCVFDHRLEVDGSPVTRVHTFFAEKPCTEHGDFGAGGGDDGLQIDRWTVCSFPAEALVKQHCPDFDEKREKKKE